MAKKKKKAKTIGKMANDRLQWAINPVTKVKEDRKRRNNRKKIKDKLKGGDYNE